MPLTGSVFSESARDSDEPAELLLSLEIVDLSSASKSRPSVTNRKNATKLENVQASKIQTN